jgi:hypothetical protein
LIVCDVVDLESAGVDVAQYKIGGARSSDWGDACELPIEPDRADEGGAPELVVVDIVDLQSARAGVFEDEQAGGIAAGARQALD